MPRRRRAFRKRLALHRDVHGFAVGEHAHAVLGGRHDAGTFTGSFSGSTVFTSMQFGDVTIGSGVNATATFYLDEVIVSNTYNGLLP